ncbi:MAG: hypothetical protein ABIJ86_09270 [Spirochaetota bacterium]
MAEIEADVEYGLIVFVATLLTSVGPQEFPPIPQDYVTVLDQGQQDVGQKGEAKDSPCGQKPRTRMASAITDRFIVFSLV